MSIVFDRRTENGVVSSSNPAEIWNDWNGERETWLFVSPHDDDIVCGAGLSFLAAVESGIDVHAAVVSNGRMGYCTPEQRNTIAGIRYEETRASFQHLGLPLEKLYQFDYDDGNLSQEKGHRFADDPNDSRVIAGAVGIQNTLTWLFRKVRPTRVFIPNRLDLHPDHQAVNDESVISVFHAQGAIWPELGEPIDAVPVLYEYATYSDFIRSPNIRIRVSEDVAEKRLRALALYKSQRQIEAVVEAIRKAGGVEFLLEMTFEIYSPKKYETLF